jgi:hypothetical protein
MYMYVRMYVFVCMCRLSCVCVWFRKSQCVRTCVLSHVLTRISVFMPRLLLDIQSHSFHSSSIRHVLTLSYSSRNLCINVLTRTYTYRSTLTHIVSHPTSSTGRSITMLWNARKVVWTGSPAQCCWFETRLTPFGVSTNAELRTVTLGVSKDTTLSLLYRFISIWMPQTINKTRWLPWNSYNIHTISTFFLPHLVQMIVFFLQEYRSGSLTGTVGKRTPLSFLLSTTVCGRTITAVLWRNSRAKITFFCDMRIWRTRRQDCR